MSWSATGSSGLTSQERAGSSRAICLDVAGLHGVKVELTGDGDHYDPEEPAVRLLPQHHDGRSVAAVAVAAHEVSHAVQHANGERAFAVRFDLVRKLVWVDRIASGLSLLAPVVFVLVRAPVLFGLQLVAGLVLLTARIAVHVVTLPVELDASFGKALPVLERGRYLSAADMPRPAPCCEPRLSRMWRLR